MWLLFLKDICTVLTYDLYVIVINDGVYVVVKKNVLCWGLLLTPMETMSTDSGGVWRRIWELMEGGGTYFSAGVIVGERKWYLLQVWCGVISVFCILGVEVLD